ncbi:MAG: adenylosuccinate lyase [Candidatus Bathyarchaeota archaeon]|nr:adenylosuccinate lyase [Candidatus Bathyarchaeota archaeon]
MGILPIDTGRYGTIEMKRVFDQENRVQKLLEVEAALAWAHAKVGNITEKDAEVIGKKASTRYVKIDRIKVIESNIKHDVASLVRALAEQCGSSGAFVHLGATSYDVVDTAAALQLKETVKIIGQKLNALEKALIEKAGKYRHTIMIGRTHGQHALPTTLGFKFSVWMRANARNIRRLREISNRLLVGKMTGAVGTQAGLGSHALEIQQLVMKRLGIGQADISTQIVQRDHHAEFVCLLALIASSLDNWAWEIRELQRPEIGELFEAFEREKQVGSSTMPHKRNPEICERICGLAKIVRGLVIPSFENVVTWHERDLTQSSAERFIIPEGCILVDYMLFLFVNVLANLVVDEARMKHNLKITQGRIMSESVMMQLVRKGMNRQEAHELLRKLAIESELGSRYFKEILAENNRIREFLKSDELDSALDPEKYLGTAVQQIGLMIQKTIDEREVRT